MNTLTLNNDTVLENSYVIESDSNLFVYTQNEYTVKEVCDALYDPEVTKKIVATPIAGDPVTYRGYKKLIAVRDEGHGMITAVLKK